MSCSLSRIATSQVPNQELNETILISFISSIIISPSGTSLHGSTRLFAALARHYNRKAFSPHLKVQPHHILTGPGAGPILDQLFAHLADPGQVCLAAAPHYNGFVADLDTRAGVKCVAVDHPHDDGTGDASFLGSDALLGFPQAMENAQSKGQQVRAILVCNPHNPAGRAYDREALLAYGRFAQKHDLHLVFDEIYSLSVFPTSDEPHPQPFISGLAIDWAKEAQCDPRRIHIVSSASKDFGLNGLRLGFFISQYNTQLMAAMKVTGKLYMVSSPADALFSHLLNDEAFYDEFVETNQRRLTEAYELVKAWCLHHKIPYKKSNAGHFLLVDLTRFLPQSIGEDSTPLAEGEQETALWSRALKERICITPGSNYAIKPIGWFRLTFSLQRVYALEGFKRLEKALGLPAWQVEGSSAAQSLSSSVQGLNFKEKDPARDEATKDIITALCGQPSSAHARTASVESNPLEPHGGSEMMAFVSQDRSMLRLLNQEKKKSGSVVNCLC